ncbi:hypothetical protein [Micromonospora sp. NPDC049301]|uniref:hypothetical protein n=1 Tax=Micromonospora sp. NPDC049301 TaxID=3155723 RepID=UPI0034180D21
MSLEAGEPPPGTSKLRAGDERAVSEQEQLLRELVQLQSEHDAARDAILRMEAAVQPEEGRRARFGRRRTLIFLMGLLALVFVFVFLLTSGTKVPLLGAPLAAVAAGLVGLFSGLIGLTLRQSEARARARVIEGAAHVLHDYLGALEEKESDIVARLETVRDREYADRRRVESEMDMLRRRLEEFNRQVQAMQQDRRSGGGL